MSNSSNPTGPLQTPEESAAEANWLRGNQAAWRSLLGQALRELGATAKDLDDPLLALGRARLVLHDTTAALRGLFAELGIKDQFDEKVHMADLIERLKDHCIGWQNE